MYLKDYTIFKSLFEEAYQKCFGEMMTRSLSETESKRFQNQIFDTTGLTIGWRSLKNYSVFVLEGDSKRNENPSTASLDTLARFVLNASVTNEIKRKDNEPHHPYWFLYREQILKSGNHVVSSPGTSLQVSAAFNYRRLLFLASPVLLLIPFYIYFTSRAPGSFSDNFENTGTAALVSRGWMIKNENSVYWSKRNFQPGVLTLFTLAGDDWPDSSGIAPGIKNLLIRKIPFNCFNADIQLTGFIPKAEWQQAGLLLLSDSTLKSSHLRLSMAFNDNFGGYHKPNEVIIQGIFSSGKHGKPEEFVHKPILTLDSTDRIPALWNNLKYSSLRIEKTGNHYRILYAIGERLDAAYKEIVIKDINFEPHYMAIFALKGNHTSSPVIPVHIRRFTLEKLPCE